MFTSISSNRETGSESVEQIRSYQSRFSSVMELARNRSDISGVYTEFCVDDENDVLRRNSFDRELFIGKDVLKTYKPVLDASNVNYASAEVERRGYNRSELYFKTEFEGVADQRLMAPQIYPVVVEGEFRMVYEALVPREMLDTYDEFEELYEEII